MKSHINWRDATAFALAAMLAQLLMYLADLSQFTHNPYQLVIWAFVFFGLWRIFTGLLLFTFPRKPRKRIHLDAKEQERRAIVAQFFK
jgi:hypothetical protein